MKGKAKGYDRHLADRIRKVLARKRGITEKEMFGGLAFLLRGRMFCGITNDALMARIGAERYEKALAKPHVRPMNFTGRPMKGYVFVDAPGLRTQRSLAAWVSDCLDFVATLDVSET
jgi:TfoX/Sxy family transcriptional regulator of competence genes